MKKGILFLVVVISVCFFVVGCGKKEETPADGDVQLSGGWQLVFADKQVGLEEDLVKVFDTAKADYKEMNLEAVALLGEQVVAGTNYMFLVKANNTYKVAIVYKDLDGKATVTKVSDFDLTKYVSKERSDYSEQLSGGWYTNAPGKELMLSDEKAQNALDKATEKLAGMSYNPITLMGTQVVAGTNYAILAYGKTVTAEPKEGVYVLTIYADLQGNFELTSSAYVDLSEFNK